MSVFDLITMLGGLALFLFGMSYMGESLEKAAGSRLKTILASLTASPLRGMLVGAGVTAVIQSSSATTVMIVGFVNSGIMQLEQAIGLIMGANIGTTITAWLLSLSGLGSGAWYIQLLKPTTFTPILGVMGAVLYMFSHREKRRTLGAVFLGFAILMTGMDIMSSSVAPLRDTPAFINILTVFNEPVLGVLAGMALTAIIQSSSASVGILQALSLTGAISYEMAIPIIMGQNIGACAPTLISSIGTSKNARRTAVAHLYFNIIGTAVCLLVFYIARATLASELLAETTGPLGIAIFHSLFNAACTFLMLPFTRQLVKLVHLTVRDKKGADGEDEEEEQLNLLDTRLFSSPSIAVERCRRLTCKMAKMSQKNFILAQSQLTAYNDKDATKIEEREEMVDQYEDQLGNYMVALAAHPLSTEDSREVSRLLHAIGDFERIGDHAVNILESAQEMKEKSLHFSEIAQKRLKQMNDAIQEIIELTITAFVTQDTDKALMVEPLEEVIDDMKIQLKAEHVERLQRGDCTIELGFIYSDVLTVLERVADHCSNIAAYQIGQAKQNFDTHNYLHDVKDGQNEVFMKRYRDYQKKYLGKAAE